MRTTGFTSLLFLVLAACKVEGTIDGVETDTSDTDTSGDTDTNTAPCTATIARVIPLDGSLGVGIDESFSATFSEPIGSGAATATLVAADAVTVEATVALAEDGLSATITHATLEEDTSYTLTVDACAAPASVSFTTTAGPVSELIEHDVYALEYDAVEWQEPAWATAFSNMLPLEYVLVEVLDIDIALQELDAVGVIAFTADDGSIFQGRCYDPMIYDNVDFSDNPSFQVGPEDLIIPGQNLTITDLRIQAAFSDDGESLVGIDITAQVDARQIEENLGVDPCAWAEASGSSCTPCETDGTPNCVDLWLTSDEAPRVEGIAIDETYLAADDSACSP